MTYDQMLALLCIVAQVWAGYELVTPYLHKKYSNLLLISLSAPVGFCVSSLAFLVISQFLGFNLFHLILHTCALYVIVVYRLRVRASLKQIKLERPEIWKFVSLVLMLFLAYELLITYYMPKERVINSYIEAHVASEIGLINSFVTGVNSGITSIFNIKSPLCYNCKQRSSWIPAVHSAMMILAKSSIRRAIIHPSTILIISCISTVTIFMKEITQNNKLAVFSTFLFFNATGLGFFRWFYQNYRVSANINYVDNLGLGFDISWMHPITSYLIAFRSVPIVLTFASTSIFFLYKGPGRRESIVIAGMLAVMPALSAQSFVALFIFLLIFLIQKIQESGRIRFEIHKKTIIHILIEFAILSLVPIINLFPNKCNSKNVSFKPIWSSCASKGYFFAPAVTWFAILGFFVPLALFGVWFGIDRKQRRFYWPAIVVFVVGNFVEFHANPQMAIHFFMPVFVMLASPYIIIMFDSLLKKIQNDEVKGVVLGFIIFIYLCMITSSILGAKKITRTTKEAWTVADETAAEYIIRNLKKDDVVLAPIDLFSPVSCLAGRRVFASSEVLLYYGGYQWSMHTAELQLLREDPQLNVLPIIGYALEHDRRYRLSHLNSTTRDESWKLCYGFESYQLYNRTVV